MMALVAKRALSHVGAAGSAQCREGKIFATMGVTAATGNAWCLKGGIRLEVTH